MKTLPVLPDSDGMSDYTPLPLIVAKRWNFPLAYHGRVDGMYFAVQDWMRGLSGEENIRNIWAMFKKTSAGKQMLNSIVRLTYKASDGKTYKRDFTTDKGLYLIAQYMRVKQDPPCLTKCAVFWQRLEHL